jgi:ribosomal RNA assembly protein
MIVIRVPADRLGVIIGPHGETRKMLEERSRLAITVDTDTQEVTVDDTNTGADPLMALKMRDIIRALGRGFSPEHAMRLFSDDIYFELVDIHDYVGKNKSRMRQVSARIIGSEGKTRRIIEEQTGCHLAIQGHTVGIIGDLTNLGNAKKACDMILRGAEHASVYGFLESQRRKSNQADAGLWK